MHVRNQIRTAFGAILAATTSLRAVFYDPDEVPQDADLPCAILSIGDEAIEAETLGGTTGSLLARDVNVAVDILHRARKDALAGAEEIAALIEAAVATDAALLDLVRTVFLNSIEVTRDSEGSQTIVQLRLQWLVTYSTNERDPTVAIS